MTKDLTPTEDALMHATYLFVLSRGPNFGIHIHDNELCEAFLTALANWIVDARLDDEFCKPRRRWFHWITREPRTAR